MDKGIEVYRDLKAAEAEWFDVDDSRNHINRRERKLDPLGGNDEGQKERAGKEACLPRGDEHASWT